MKKKDTNQITDSTSTSESQAGNQSALAKKDRNNQKLSVYQPEPLPGNRPIGDTPFEISQSVSMSGNRPIGVSNIEVLETLSIMGNRPVVASHLHIQSMMTYSGNRPITASTLDIYDFLAGGRPIASNDIDDPESLMGYLD
ncbi:MAG TPA: hypothetical protein V6D13_20255 [Halomicronema sp.]